ncbi:DUF5602 domain-containing protein [Armatimonas rosea]|uniref:DUF5602 domain-containing protein n=1 Tax=Armatimonas rosea TaxID=685828 RepID=UPI001614FDD3|nr:DUF5602 domain-containing protein [Armatimonas rosea]
MKRKSFFVSALGLLALSGCGSSNNVVPLEFTGTSKAVGAGKAMTYVSLAADNKPSAIAVRLTDGALNGLATTAPFGVEYELDIAAVGPDSGLPFDHVVLDWNPQGHEPAGIYDTPHFDIHFYTISDSEQAAIAPGSVTAAAAPPANMVPAGYFPPPGKLVDSLVPGMGVHYTSPSTSEEFQGKPFRRTLIYGFANAKLAFVEPMITRAFLQSKTNDSGTFTVPDAVAKPGYYPTRWSVRHNADSSIDIILDQFVKR